MLDYGICEDDLEKVERGSFVEVPIRGHLRKGFVFEVTDKPSYPKVVPIHAVLSEEPLLPPHLFELALWMSRYYLTPFRTVLKSMLPESVRNQMQPKEQLLVRRNKTYDEMRTACAQLQRSHPAQAKVLEVLLAAKSGIFLSELLEKTGGSRSPVETLEKKRFLTLDTIQVDRSPLIGESYFKTKPKKLSGEQQEALDKIMGGEGFQTHLLYGVTGSGKTEVYMQAIEKMLAQGKGALMLVPEIALTTQTCERFLSRFDRKIAILHHRLSRGERFDEWQRIRKKEAPIVVGARSALFSPLPNVGLIIVDEEQDNAYKQHEESFCYHARDTAVMLGKLANCTVVLGSATPSLESYENAKNGKYTLSKLTSRPTAAQLPKVSIIDMRKEYEKAKGYTAFSELLLQGVKERVERGEQAILFLNRRGYHTALSCLSCGFVFKCPHCDLALTFHKQKGELACHLCDYKRNDFKKCAQCQDSDLKFRGVGTEQIERALHAVLPDVRTLRIDGDTTRHKGSHDRLFRQFSTQKADVLIGTQMIAKGLHFPGVTLVAVLNSDGALNIPDFRASEQVYQLIVQVAGRAGRGELAGEVIIQTQTPENSTITLASQQQYETFFEQEVEVRRAFGYPPFTHFIKVQFSGEDAALVERTAERFRSQIQIPQTVVHPTVASGHAKIKDQFRFQFLIRGCKIYAMLDKVLKVRQSFALPPSVRLRIDVDPISTFF